VFVLARGRVKLESALLLEPLRELEIRPRDAATAFGTAEAEALGLGEGRLWLTEYLARATRFGAASDLEWTRLEMPEAGAPGTLAYEAKRRGAEGDAAPGARHHLSRRTRRGLAAGLLLVVTLAVAAFVARQASRPSGPSA
jgi:hypothetical protein